MPITHVSHEFTVTSRGFAILVASLNAAGIINGRKIAASLRISAHDIEGCDVLQELMADLVTATIEKTEVEGPARLTAVPPSADPEN